ncbi:hypothetical protein NQ318_003950 [Aromia moschata]|uniref:Uncharacterized protein n=1 Tax=Aromia moschata TaxID=1265417 RepID=A0AAV8Z9J8_9CUCU|nr:hypothetical protein NQ318_003950 [Aromia moschata]
MIAKFERRSFDCLIQASPTQVLLPLRPSAGQAPGMKCKNMMLSVSVTQRRLCCERVRRQWTGTGAAKYFAPAIDNGKRVLQTAKSTEIVVTHALSSVDMWNDRFPSTTKSLTFTREKQQDYWLWYAQAMKAVDVSE